MSERKECLIRLVVGIVSGILLYVWGWFTIVLFIINWIYCIFSGKKLKELAKLSEMFNTQCYSFLKYMTFVTNDRPFPFKNLAKEITKVK